MIGKTEKSVTLRLPRVPRAVAVTALTVVALAVAAGCGTGATSADAAKTTTVIDAIGAENEYASVLSQIGGHYVRVSSILNNPRTNPHMFEASPSVAQQVSAAVAELWHKMPELVPGISLSQRLGSLGHSVAGQNLHSLRAGQLVRIQAQVPGQFHVQLDQPWGRYMGRVDPRVEVLRQARIGVFKTKVDGVVVGAWAIGRRDRGSIG